MPHFTQTGIIDIGSNSVRLVVYRCDEADNCHIITESKFSARLSELVDENNYMDIHLLQTMVNKLLHFKRICEMHQVSSIRACATAAIRNAVNRDEVVRYLEEQTDLTIDVLSGEQEAFYGFVGMANSLYIQDGFLIDIGGGSTEVSLFRNRSIVNSISFPFGCVNTTHNFVRSDPLSEADAKQMEQMVRAALDREFWLVTAPDLPLICLGGATRTLAKIEQARTKYPLQQVHNFQLTDAQVTDIQQTLNSLPLVKRRQIAGLSKDRADILSAGIIILRTIFQHCRCSHFIISASGIRDGLIYDETHQGQLLVSNVLEHSIHNMMSSYAAVLPAEHIHQVYRTSIRLAHTLHQHSSVEAGDALILRVASMLYRIGMTIDMYRYQAHTYYMLINSRLYGLTHRELILCALVASFTSKNSARRLWTEYRDILDPLDYDRVCRLGSLLQLAIAMDKSETQSIAKFEAFIQKNKLIIQATEHASLHFEQIEVETVVKEFKKAWKLTPVLIGNVISSL